jgi:hypothetical protein
MERVRVREEDSGFTLGLDRVRLGRHFPGSLPCPETIVELYIKLFTRPNLFCDSWSQTTIIVRLLFKTVFFKPYILTFKI